MTGLLRCRINVLFALAAMASLSACTTLGPDFQRPATSVEPAWSHAAPTETAQSDPDEFWEAFDDPQLLQYIQRADRQSLSLKRSAEQVEQAREQLRITTGDARPDVQLTGSSTYTEPDISSRLRGQNQGSTTHQLLGELSWEVDFWGRHRRAREADEAALAGSAAALAQAKVSVEASVATAYINIRVIERRIEVAQASLASQAQNMRIARVRFQLGATSELDWRQAQTQYQQTLAQLPGLRTALAQYEHALSVLMGDPPDAVAGTLREKTGLPAAPVSIAWGAPRDLLRRRPDVRQAELAAAAQSARIGQAEAALYPSFNLTGSFGFAGTSRGADLFRWDNRALSGGAVFYFPLFDRSRLASQVRVQDSLFRQAVLAYQSQVLTAQQEVEDALAQIAGDRAQLADLTAGNVAAERSAALALSRYRAGQTNYTTVTSADQSQLQLADALVQAQGSLLQATVSAWRALGGSWSGDTSAQNKGNVP